MGEATTHERVAAANAADAGASEHGGWLNMSALRCPWARATLRLRGDSAVTLTVPGRPAETGTFVPRSSSLCNWTDAAPGSYWMPVGGRENSANAHGADTGAAPYTPRCSARRRASASRRRRRPTTLRRRRRARAVGGC